MVLKSKVERRIVGFAEVYGCFDVLGTDVAERADG